MGLIKTMSQSSAELKNILDRLTALESGETFVTKETFDSLNQKVTSINSNLGNLSTDVTNIKNGNNIENIMLSNYPVGSIYLSVDSTNPSTKFGGTWVAWGAGRVPVGVNASDSNFNTVEKTGGSSNVTLTQNQLPSSLSYKTNDIGFQVYGEGTNQGEEVATAFGSNTSLNLTNLDGGQAHNNLQPYITCYIWKRTA